MKPTTLFSAIIAGMFAVTAPAASAYAPPPLPVSAANGPVAQAMDYQRTERHTTRTHTYGNRTSWGWRTNCRTQYRHGHRERVCRKIRYRR